MSVRTRLVDKLTNDYSEPVVQHAGKEVTSSPGEAKGRTGGFEFSLTDEE